MTPPQTNSGDNFLVSYPWTMSTLIATYRSDVTARLFSALEPPAYLADSEIAAHRFAEFVEPVKVLASGGKRTRALFVAAGWQMYQPDAPLPVRAGAALELYQLSALVHDDIIDDSDTRRGKPAVHRSFETVHEATGLTGDAEEFGTKAAILAGDYLLSVAGGEVSQSESASAQALHAGIALFHRMTSETAFGQYLDMRAEFTALNDDAGAAVSESLAVLLHKSARYSVELPLLIGAALGGATASELDSLSRVGRPLGEAFQLRDDELGIYGDPATTGKPAGGDLTEGKRTVLLALAREALAGADLDLLDSYLGSPLTDDDVASARHLIRQCGAFDAHEKMIRSREDAAADEYRRLGKSSTILDELMAELAGRTN